MEPTRFQSKFSHQLFIRLPDFGAFPCWKPFFRKAGADGELIVDLLDLDDGDGTVASSTADENSERLRR